MSVFDENNTPSGGKEGTPSSEAFADLLASIKNEEGKPKYASVEEALKGLAHANQFIDTLKTEKSQIEQELKARQSVAEALEALSAKNTDPAPTNDPVPAGLKEADIEALIQARLAERDRMSQEEANVRTVSDALKSKYGEQVGDVMKEVAGKLGRSVEDLKGLAKADPKLVLGLFESAAPKNSPKPMYGGGLNTLDFQGKPETLVKANEKSVFESGDIHTESANAKRMVDELNAAGLSIADLTNPKVYFKTFKM